jgi:hypothetical protein
MPQLKDNGAGRGAAMEPIWTLLNSRQNDGDWNASLRGGLRSAIANRQWPQTRVRAAGWSSHNRCLLCLQANADAAGVADGSLDEAVLAATPVGNLGHRVWGCGHFRAERLARITPEQARL